LSDDAPISRSSNAELRDLRWASSPRDPTAQRLAHDKIQRGAVEQLIADLLAFDNTGDARLNPHAGKQQRIVLLVIGDHRGAGGVALVAGEFDRGLDAITVIARA